MAGSVSITSATGDVKLYNANVSANKNGSRSGNIYLVSNATQPEHSATVNQATLNAKSGFAGNLYMKGPKLNVGKVKMRGNPTDGKGSIELLFSESLTIDTIHATKDETGPADYTLSGPLDQVTITNEVVLDK